MIILIDVKEKIPNNLALVVLFRNNKKMANKRVFYRFYNITLHLNDKINK